MPQFNDLRDISTTGINAFSVGQAQRGNQTTNALNQLKLDNAPTEIRQKNRLTELAIGQQEAAPEKERLKEKNAVLMKAALGMAPKLLALKDSPEEANELYENVTKGIGQFLIQQKLSTPEEIASDYRSLEQMGGPDGFSSMFSGVSEQEKMNLDKQSMDLRRQELELKKQTEDRQSSKMSAGLEKELLEANDLEVESLRQSTEFGILATQVTDLVKSGGLAASTSETLKKLLGTQDDVTELRRRFNKVRLSEGLRNLPPGPATDKDVKEAFKGVPPENAPAKQIAEFLRGAAKMAQLDAGYNRFKADFLSKPKATAKGMNKEWRRMQESEVLGRKVSTAELYAEAISEGMSIDEVKKELGIK